MDVDLDGGTILYALGIGFALAALAYFVRDVVFALSITVKAALLFLAFLAFLLGGIAMDRDILDRISLALAGATYVVFLGYVVSRYDLAATGVFLVLAASAVLFVGLGYVIRQTPPTVSTRTATFLLALLVGVAVLLVGADVATAGVTASAELTEEVTVVVPDDGPDDREFVMTEAALGRIVVENDGPFTRPLDIPPTTACAVGTDAVRNDEVIIDLDPRRYDRPDRIPGGETQSFDLIARMPVTNATDELTFAVERGTDCETPRSEPTIVVDIDTDRIG